MCHLGAAVAVSGATPASQWHVLAYACHWPRVSRARATRVLRDLGVALELCSGRFPCHPCVSATCNGLRVLRATSLRGSRATRAPRDLSVVRERCFSRFPCHPFVEMTCKRLTRVTGPRFEDPCHACALGLRCGTRILLAQVPVPPLRHRYMRRLTRVTGLSL